MLNKTCSPFMEITKEQARFLWRTSWLSFGSCIYAVYKTHYHLALVPGSVYITSINYWRDPQSNSWRKYADMYVVFTSLGYQIAMTRNAQNVRIYYVLILLCGLSYYESLRYAKTQDKWTSVYWHSLIHILGNISNIVLYSGNV